VNLKAVHDLDASRRRAGEPPMTPHFAGLPRDESDALLTHATGERFVFRHRCGASSTVR
jgi:hypothetical protein